MCYNEKEYGEERTQKTMQAKKWYGFLSKNDRMAYMWAFWISLLIGALLFVIKQITPFGNQSVLCMDLWGQYAPMYVQQAYGGADGVFYSWNGGLGYNEWAQNAYYGNMLTFLILRIVPIAWFPAMIGLISLMKMPLASVLCLYYLRHHFGRHETVLIGGAVSYSLCAYMLAFLSQCMWTDTLLYAPLVLCGVDRLIREKKGGFYALWLALAIISNFYVGFALCLFTALYFLVESVLMIRLTKTENERLRPDNVTEWLKTVGRFAVFSLLAGGISAVVVVPVWLALGNTVAGFDATASWKNWHADIPTVLRNLVPGNALRLGFAENGANIATGIGVFLLVPLYFFNRSVRRGERLLNGLLLAFLVVSINNQLLDFIWHGFHFPNQLPGRWTFLFSLYVVLLGCRALMRLDGLTLRRVLVGGGIGYLLLLDLVFSDHTENRVVLSAGQHIMFLLLWLAVIVLTVFPKWRERRELSRDILRRGETACMAVIVLLQALSSGWGMWTSAQDERSGMPTSQVDIYVSGMESMVSMGDAVKATDDGWYRAETANGFTFNPSMIGDYHGMGVYSSLMNGNVYQMLRLLGNRVYALNVSSIYNMSSVVQNSLFGVKYYLDNDMNTERNIPQATLVKQTEKCNVWKNPTALSVAFGVPGDPTAYRLPKDTTSIRNQKQLLDTLCGCDTGIYQPLVCESDQHDGIDLAENDGWDSNGYSADLSAGEKSFRYVFRCDVSGPIYIEQNFYSGTITAAGDNDKNAISFDTGLERFKYIGTYEAGDAITVTVPLQSPGGHYGVALYRFDENRWNEIYRQFSSQEMKIESASATRLTGTLTMNDEGYVFTSIPQDGGWTLRCDGHAVETGTAENGLLTARLPSGTHRIELRYTVPGIRVGAIISAVSLILTLLLACPRFRKLFVRCAQKKKAPTKGSSEAPQEP